MGYRARRRLAWTAAIAVLVIALVLVGLLRHHRGGAATPQSGLLGALGIAYGATADKVRRRLGPPASKRRGCWVYRTHSIPHQDAVEYCFAGGTVTDIETHHVAFVIRHRHVPAGWAPALAVWSPPSQPVQ
jgi:hypothetical protein